MPHVLSHRGSCCPVEPTYHLHFPTFTTAVVAASVTLISCVTSGGDHLMPKWGVGCGQEKKGWHVATWEVEVSSFFVAVSDRWSWKSRSNSTAGFSPMLSCLLKNTWMVYCGHSQKRGPGLTAGPRCVLCALVKVHMSWMVEKPNGCRNKSNRDVDGLKAAGREQVFSCETLTGMSAAPDHHLFRINFRHKQRRKKGHFRLLRSC